MENTVLITIGIFLKEIMSLDTQMVISLRFFYPIHINCTLESTVCQRHPHMCRVYYLDTVVTSTAAALSARTHCLMSEAGT